MTDKYAYMGIGELSLQSGVPVSTIKYYLLKGILPRPIKTSRTRAYYTNRHLAFLKIIARVRREKNLSLDHIKDIIRAAEIPESETYGHKDFKYDITHQKILDCALTLFEQNGYEKTTVDEIVRNARISKNTFYLHFINKKVLFEAGFKKIFQDMFMDTVNEIGDEADILSILPRLIPPFYRSYPKWNTMISLLRSATISEPEFKDQFLNIIEYYIAPLIPLIETATEKGIFRKTNGRLLAVMLLGIMDYTGYLVWKGAHQEDIHQLTEQGLDMILNGVLSKISQP